MTPAAFPQPRWTMQLSKRILVVDDSALIRQVITDALIPSGFDVIAAADGSEALRLVARSRPDLIIADILMPIMDGWALCEEIRRTPATADIPIIVLTTERDVPKRLRGFETGVDDYMCKPFSKEELVARVKAILRRAAPAQDATMTPAATPPVLTGHTDHIPMPDLFQLLSMNGKSGTLHLWGESVARVYLQEGRIINAETQGLKGEKALFRIMAWSAARFEFESGEPERDVDILLSGSTSTVLMDGFTHLDELRDLVAAMPPGNRRLRVPEALSSTLDQLDLTTAERIILYAAGGAAPPSPRSSTRPHSATWKPTGRSSVLSAKGCSRWSRNRARPATADAMRGTSALTAPRTRK